MPHFQSTATIEFRTKLNICDEISFPLQRLKRFMGGFKTPQSDSKCAVLKILESH